jgi:hypothetical protein
MPGYSNFGSSVSSVGLSLGGDFGRVTVLISILFTVEGFAYLAG